jgi:hypothetical protein
VAGWCFVVLLGWLKDLVRVGSLFGFALGGQIQPHCGLDCLGNNNRGTETQQSASDFDANGNLLNLNHIGTLHWHYNNTLSKLSKPDKTTIEYYVYDYQGNRVRRWFVAMRCFLPGVIG